MDPAIVIPDDNSWNTERESQLDAGMHFIGSTLAAFRPLAILH